MSWILAAFNAPANVSETARGLVRQTPSSLFEVMQPDHFVAAGGITPTCHTFHDPHQNTGWVVVGLGLHLDDDTCTTLSLTDWQNILADDEPALPENGHYAILKWKNGTVQAFTDTLGTRTLYVAKDGNCLVLSTRLDWVSRLSDHRDLDFEVFGTHWLTFNQISFASPLKQIQRLASKGRLTFKQNELIHHHTLWHPIPLQGIDPAAAFEKTLRTFTNPTLPENTKLSLGLSGGLDSRLLLSLLKLDSAGSLHTFGPDEKADVHVARSIAESLPLPHQVIHAPVPDAATCLQLLQIHTAQTQPLTAASAVLGLRHYHALHANGFGIIDGGLGEAARRQFFNRLLRQGRTLLRQEKFDDILPYIRTRRADIFTTEVRHLMEAGVRDQFKAAWEALPSSQEMNLENKLDLLSIRSRLPNFFGYEQNRLDGMILNYMPFAQPALLNTVFALAISERKEGQLFREIIRKNAPSLTAFPLVKGAYPYPFGLPSTVAFAWTKFKSRIRPVPADILQHQFLKTLQEYVMDRLHAQDTKNYAPYDISKISQRVEAYYNGEEQLAGYVDWWLSFDVWRLGF